MTIREDAPIDREDLLRHLNDMKIGTRLLFGGNLLKQPYMIGREYRVSGPLDNSNAVMRRCFWIGVYPGLQDPEINYTLDIFHDYCRKAAA